jgi:UDP-N-acetyl-D-glucosamine dehydrogenase
VVGKVRDALNDDGKALKGARVLVLGLAYKANVDDDRESPSYEILELLLEGGAKIDYCDPLFPAARKGRKHDLGLETVPCDRETFARYDAVVISTAHDVFKRRELYRDVPLVVDTRNLLAPLLVGAGDAPRRLVKA